MISPLPIELIYQAAEHAGFLQQCLWDDCTAMVGFQAADQDVLNRLTQSTEFSMTYPANSLQGLRTGHRVEIAEVRYQVREVVRISDGSEMRATLTKL
jgi:hypothetical protein